MKIMKKIMIIILLSISIFALVLNYNISQGAVITAEKLQEEEGLATIKGKGAGAVGHYIYTGGKQVHSPGNELYCTQQQRILYESNMLDYQVMYYLEITGNEAKFAHVKNGTQGTSEPDVSELKLSGVSGDYETGLLGIILTEFPDSRGYEGETANGISKTQRALWYFLYMHNEWVNHNFGDYFMNTRVGANITYGEPFYQECQNKANQKIYYTGTIKIWWLAPTHSSAYQSLMFVDIGPAEETEPGEIIIDKIDQDTGANLPGVSFTIQCIESHAIVNVPKDENNGTTNDSNTEGKENGASSGGEGTGQGAGGGGTGQGSNDGGTDTETGTEGTEDKKEEIITDFTNKYIKNVDSDNNVTEWTDDETEAMRFSTGDSAYQTIKIKNVPAGIYIIKEVENNNEGYEANIERTWEVEVKPGETVTKTLTNKKKQEEEENTSAGEGNVTISGKVWEEEFDGKSNQNSRKKSVEGILVYWKTAGGGTIAQTKTDSSGYYEMKHPITIENHIYKIDEATYDKLNNSYIEFKYNGLKYTTLVASKTGSGSKATEKKALRNALDESFKEITRDTVNDAAVELKYDSSGNVSVLKLLNDKKDNGESSKDYDGNFAVTANTKLTGINKLLDNYASTETSEYCIQEIRHRSSWTDEEGVKHTRRWTEHVYNEEIDEWEITDMNLGLLRKEQPDLAITSDIEKVSVIMKDQEYTYIYGHRGLQNISADSNYFKVSFGSKYTEQYTRPVNPADIAYVVANGTNDLRVFVTYNIKVANQSKTLLVTVPDIVNYYDDDYTIVSGGWTQGDSVGGFKSAHTNALRNQKIEPGKTSSTISIQFEVSQAAIKGLQNGDATLKNVSEICAYTSFHGSNTLCAEGKTASAHGRTGKTYAGIDLDSQPDNATPGNVSTYEDDTDQAPSFLLKRDENKIISGTVWEDSATDESQTKNERNGDGVRSNSEDNTAKNVRVELLKVNDNGTTETAKLYPKSSSPKAEDAITYTGDNGEYKFVGVVADRYILKYTYGNDKTVLVNGPTTINGNEINARNYKSTLITDESLRNSMENNINGILSEEDLQWHLTMPNDKSVAVDNLRVLHSMGAANTNRLKIVGAEDTDSRLDIDSLRYDNFPKGVNVSAYSLPFKVQLEYTEDQVANVGQDGGNFEHNWEVFDFGIIERARENIELDKTISQLKITLANGQVLTEGDPYSGNMNYVIALEEKEGLIERDVLQRKVWMEMDRELIQGATLEILYKITVTNKSEIDYEYEKELNGNHKYYYYGTNPTSKIKPSVEYVVDYIDPDLTCEAGAGTANAHWQKIDALTLKEAGNISEKVFDRVKPENAANGGNYLIFVTNQFENIVAPDANKKEIGEGEQHSETIYASKLLANQAEDYVYENHAEIIQLNGKIARTIDSTTDGVQNAKKYRPGNYIPNLLDIYKPTDGKEFNEEKYRWHEQDDKSITVYITPPTGLTNNVMIYVITGAVSLVGIGAGIYIIKRRVI